MPLSRARSVIGTARHVLAIGLLLAMGLAMSPAAKAQPQAASPAVPALQLPPDAELIRLAADRYERYTVPVHIGPAGPFRFLIDTGAERTVLSRDLATRLGLSISGNATIVGIAGSHPVEIVDVDALSIGRRTFGAIKAPLLEARHIGADGILGVDSLQDQRVLIDFAADQIAIGEAARLGGTKGFEIVVSARRKSGQLIVTDARIDGIVTSIVIDTGSDASVGNLPLRKALLRRRQAQTTVLYSVTGQSIDAELVQASTIEVGGLRIHNTVLAFADVPAFRHLGLERKPALLLGMNQLRMFARVAIDFSTRRILFDMPAGVASLAPPHIPF